MHGMTSVVGLPNGCDISPRYGTVIDCDAKLLDSGSLFLQAQEVSNVVFTTFTCIFGFVPKVPRYETKQIAGVWEMIIEVAIYALQMTMVSNEHNLSEYDAKKDDDMPPFTRLGTHLS
ncbi:hypothetical protein CEP53_005436 [Fusarium sp. AF-6]|nr:hypothetical protein CEP53_005436 [Fusarium sp. AF-6]